jgi:nitrous oxidase accessory protein
MVARGGARVLAAGCLLLVSVASAARTWQVAPGSAIQSAIDAAAAGDTLEIARGHYRENLELDKSLTLRGIGRPVIDGGLKGNTIAVFAEHVTLEGLDVRDSGDSLREQNAGIYIQPGAHRARCATATSATPCSACGSKRPRTWCIENNLITGKRDYRSPSAATASSSTTPAARIIGNNISFVRDAIYVDVSHDALFAATIACITAATAPTT